MPDANSGMGSHREGRQERTEQPRQPGASGTGEENQEHSPEEARDAALHRRGKTDRHTSDDRS
jgi:hypothetical protein